jgi:hypothetical protein
MSDLEGVDTKIDPGKQMIDNAADKIVAGYVPPIVA